MKAKVIKITDNQKYNYRNEALNFEFEVVNKETVEPIGELFTLDTTKLLGCVTAWTQEYLEFV